MNPDPNIYRSANVLVKQHGEDAPLEAAMRVDAMLERGYIVGFAVWKQVLKAIRELDQTAPEPEATAH